MADRRRHHRLIDHRTAFHTGAATGTAFKIDATRPFAHFDFKMTVRPFNGLNIRIGDDFDVQMLADLDQFR